MQNRQTLFKGNIRAYRIPYREHRRHSNKLLRLTVLILSATYSTLKSAWQFYTEDTNVPDSQSLNTTCSVPWCWAMKHVHVGEGGQCNSIISLIQLCAFVGLNSNNIICTEYLYFVHLTTLNSSVFQCRKIELLLNSEVWGRWKKAVLIFINTPAILEE